MKHEHFKCVMLDMYTRITLADTCCTLQRHAKLREIKNIGVEVLFAFKTSVCHHGATIAQCKDPFPYDGTSQTCIMCTSRAPIPKSPHP